MEKKEKKKLLILQGSDDICKEEIAHINSTSELFNIETITKKIRSISDVESLKESPDKFDYIYLCAHANHIEFGDQAMTYSINWVDFGASICTREIINDGCVFLLACCRSGLNKVAFDLFYTCTFIEYVCGPRWKVNDLDLSVAFTVFLYNMEVRKMQPNQAAERMSAATGYDFNCYDRVEVERSFEYQKHCESLEDYFKRYAIEEEEKDNGIYQTPEIVS